jgi:5,5'-dehydrodivanillate O-demethylase
MLRVGGGGIATFQIRVPVDDTHTWHVWYQTYRFDEPAPPQAVIPVYQVPLHDSRGEWLRDYVDGQDICAWVTQGAIADRSREHLGRSDLGVIMLRKLYFEQTERVEAGQDPICVFRDPAANACIDLPMEREKFGGAQAFRDIWLHESSIRYSPIRDQVVSRFGGQPRAAAAPVLG